MAQLHGLIADLLAKLKVDDPDDFSGRAAHLIVSRQAKDKDDILDALASVKSSIFVRNHQYSKQQILHRVSKCVVSYMPKVISEPTSKSNGCTVLFMAASPQSQSRLAIDEERRSVEQKVRGTPFASSMVFVEKWALRPDDLLQAANETSPSIVHFSGHGGSSGICLSTSDNKSTATVSGAILSAVFRQFRTRPKVVLLNSCYSEDQAKAIVNVVDCVIGMGDSIVDQSAIAFAGAFYRAIASGRSILDSFSQGKLSIDLESLSGSAVPRLLERSKGAAKYELLR